MLDSVYIGCEMATLLMVLYSRSKKLGLPQPEYQPRKRRLPNSQTEFPSYKAMYTFLKEKFESDAEVQSLIIGLPTEERTVITTRAVKRGALCQERIAACTEWSLSSSTSSNPAATE